MTVDGTMSQSIPPINLLDDLKLAISLLVAPLVTPGLQRRGVEFLTLAWPKSVI